MAAPSSAPPRASNRWDLLWDVVVMQIKVALGNALNFGLGLVAPIAALIDMIFKTDPVGARFYAVLRLARRIEERIDVYECIGGYHATGVAGDTPES